MKLLTCLKTLLTLPTIGSAAFLASVLMSPADVAAASPGALDPAYQAPPTGYPPAVAIVQADGKAVVGGNFSIGTTQPSVLRLNTDGSADNAFNANATASLPVKVAQVLAQTADGKILVAGTDNTLSFDANAVFARLNTDGTLDTAFAPTFDGSLFSGVAVQPDGKILVVGDFTMVDGAPRRSIARLDAAGHLDTAFDPYQTIQDNSGLTLPTLDNLTLQPDGKIILTLRTTNSDGDVVEFIVRINADGTYDGNFTSNRTDPSGLINAIALQSNGAILVTGTFGSLGADAHFRLARLLPDGTVDPSFVAQLDGPELDFDQIVPYEIAVGSDNRFYLGGTDNNGSTVVRYNADGSLDKTFDTVLKGGFFVANALALQAEGNLIVAGDLQTGQQATTVVRLLTGGAGSPPTGGSLVVPGTANPYLAGLPDGTTASGGDDSAPAQSPVLVPGLTLHPDKPLNFSVGGSVSTDGAVQPTEGPDGGFYFTHAAENSFSKTIAPINSLVGVFLSDAAPDPAVVDTAVRDFSDAASTNGGVDYLGYQPRLGEPFFIGDGLTSTGLVQNVYPPTGATRLFLGVLDGNDYFNNLGQFNVGVTQSSDIDTDDLRVGQSVTTPTDGGGARAQIGDQITYTFHLKNEGSHTFTNVVLKDVLPGVCEFVRASDGGTVKGGVVTWNLGTLAPTGTGTSKDLTLVVKTFAAGDANANVSAAQINQVINNLNYYVTGDGLPPSVPGLDLNNTTTLQAPISVAISSNGSSVTPGGTLSYTIDLKNTVGTKVKKPVFTLSLPAGVKFVSAMYVDDNGNPIATVSTDGGITFTSDAGSFAFNGGGSAIFTVANLKANSTAHLVLTVQVPYDVLPDAAVNFGAARLTTKTTDELGQNSYGVAVPDTKLSGTAGTNVPALALLKIVPDPVTISQAVALESITEPTVAAILQTVFPANFDKTLDKIHKTLNPNVVDGTDDNGFYEQQVLAPGLPNSPADATMTLAVVCTNVGAAKVGGATIQDRVPDGTEFVAGSAMLNGVAFDPAKLTLSDNNRTLVFNLGAIAGDKPGKPSFRILTYQVRLLPAAQGGLATGSLLTYSPAQLNTPSLFHTTVSTEGAVRVVAPAHLFFEGSQFVPNPFPGDTVTYEAYYKNTGSVTVDDASIVDVLPAGVTDVQAVFTLGDTGTVGAVANGQITIKLPTLKKKAEGRVRVTATLTAASFNPQGSLVSNRMQLFSAELGAAAARAERGHATPRGRQPRAGDGVTTPVINSLELARLSGPGLAKLFVTLSQPLAVKEGDTFDCIVAIANPTDIPATSVGAYLNVPLGAAFVSASQTNATTMTETDGTTTVYFPPTATGGFVYTVPAHGSLLKKATLRALGGTGGKALAGLGARSTNANFNYLVNGAAGGGVYAPVYSGATEIFSYPANQSFNTVKSQVLTAALAAKGLKVPEIEGLPDFKAKAQALTADALGIVTGGADGIAFENNVVVIPLLAGQALAIGSANGLLFDAGALKNAGGNSLISQDGGGLVAQGAGNLIKVANLVAQGGGNLVGSGGRDIATILSGLVAQGGGNLVAQGGGNLVVGGGGNLVAQGGGNLVAQGGGNLIGHLVDNTSGLISSTLASSLLASNGQALAGSQSALVAQGGGNLVAQGGGNLVAQGGGNLIATGGGNLVAQGGGNLVAQGGGNLQVSTAASQAVLLSDDGLVAQGGGNLISQDGGGLISQDGGGLFGGSN